MENWIALAGILIGTGVVFYRAYILPLMAQNEKKRYYQSIAEPRLILQRGESDTEFWAAVQRERARFAESGNAWAAKQSPVIAIPYNSTFTIEWFDKEYPLSTVGMRHHEYNVEAMRIYNELYAVWQQKTSIFGEEVKATATGQTPFEKTSIWA